MRRVAARGWSLVPGGRWDAADQPGTPIRSLPILRGAGRDRDPERTGRRGARHCPRASAAQWHSARCAKRPKIAKLAAHDRLRRYVQDRLAGTVSAEDGTPVPGPTVGSWSGRRHGRRQDRHWATSWSPQQIAHRLRLEYPDDDSMRVSPEAIDQALYIQGRGALRRELTACLRTGRALRVPRARRRGRGKACVGPDILISERPAEAEDRAVPGHWEGDLIIGRGSSAIGTLVERTTRFTMLLHLPRTAEGGRLRVKHGPALAGMAPKPYGMRSRRRSRRSLISFVGH